MDPLYHEGDSIIINSHLRRLVGKIITYPRSSFPVHKRYDLTLQPTIINFDYLYEDDEYQNRIFTTDDGEIYAFNINETNEMYLYIIQLSTGEMVYCFELDLLPVNRELLTRSINKFRTFRKKKRDDKVSAIALGTKMPLDINRQIASLTLRRISRKVGGRKKKRKTRKTRKTRK